MFAFGFGGALWLKNYITPKKDQEKTTYEERRPTSAGVEIRAAPHVFQPRVHCCWYPSSRKWIQVDQVDRSNIIFRGTSILSYQYPPTDGFWKLLNTPKPPEPTCWGSRYVFTWPNLVLQVVPPAKAHHSEVSLSCFLAAARIPFWIVGFGDHFFPRKRCSSSIGT